MPEASKGEAKEIKEKKPPRLFLLTLIGLAIFIFGYVLGQKTQILPQGAFPNVKIVNRESQKETQVDFAPFWDVWERITEQYLEREAVDPQKLLYGAISGIVQALGDPYSAFLTPEQNREVKQELSGFYEGVGIQLGVKDARIVVIAPLSGTPAEKKGVLAGDVILKIEDKDTVGLALPAAVSLIRGKAGTSVKLTIQREGKEPFELVLDRARIELKSVELSFLDTEKGKVAILKLSRFSSETPEEWDRAVSEIVAKGARGLVLDVRNNPGGFLSGSVYVGSEFLKGRIVGQVGQDGQKRYFEAERKGKLLDIPLIVIINRGSASAAEIVAGALAERGRAKLVGEQSFGKGSVQDAQELQGGAGLHLTVAKWLLPSGKDINGKGLKPDIEVKRTEEDITSGRDPQKDRALEVVASIIK